MKNKTKTYPFTLGDISDLLDNKLAIFSDKFDKKLDQKLSQNNVAIYGELDKRFSEIDTGIGGLRKEMNGRFDELADTLQDIMGMIEDVSEAKIRQLRGSLKAHLAQI